MKGDIDAILVLALVLVLDRLVTVGVVENRDLAIQAVQLVGLLELEIDVIDRDLFTVGKIGGVVDTLEIDFGFDIDFRHESASAVISCRTT